jgi:hypothetical protein
MTALPWPPNDEREGLCIQRALQVVNRNTAFDFPLFWLESALSMYPVPATNIPLVENMASAFAKEKRIRRLKVADEYSKDEKEVAMQRYRFFAERLEKGMSVVAAYQQWRELQDQANESKVGDILQEAQDALQR